MFNKLSVDKKLTMILLKNLEKCSNSTKKPNKKEKNSQNPKTSSKLSSMKSKIKWITNNSSNTSKNPKKNIYSNSSNNNNNGTMILHQPINTITMNIPKSYSSHQIKSKKESMNIKVEILMLKKHNIRLKSIVS